jgi:hypothetical protein
MTRKEKPKDYFSTAYFNYLVDISEYRGKRQMRLIDSDLNRDLYEKVTKEMKKNPKVLQELNYDNPPIEMGHIYIIKLNRWQSDLKLRYANGMEWSEYWDDDVTRYEEFKGFGGYLAVIKLPPYTKVSTIVNPDTQWQRTETKRLWGNPNTLYTKQDAENYYFSIMLPDSEAFKNPLVYSRKNSLAKEYPIYFYKGHRSSPIDDEDGAWLWQKSYKSDGNDYDFPTGSTWALLKKWPDFLNWGNTYPFSTK